jgi:orotate phosphoribosyltransferase
MIRPTTDDRRPTTDDRRPTTDDRRPTTDDRRPTTGGSVSRDDIERLRDLMEFCFERNGPYTLSSGGTANYYYDGKRATLHPPTAWLIGQVFAPVILDSGAEAVGGPEIGAIPIADAVGIAAHLQGRTLPTFIVRKEPKGHGTRSQVSESRTEDGAPLLREGRRIAIVEDVITTGASIQKAVDVVRALGCVVTVVVALVERHESGGKALRGQGFPVWCPFYTDASGTLFVNEDFVRASDGGVRSS